jgi:hypothetical protein
MVSTTILAGKAWLAGFSPIVGQALSLANLSVSPRLRASALNTQFAYE